MAARAFTAPGARAVATFAAWLPWLAGPLDYVENFAIGRMVSGDGGGAWPRLMFWRAAPKFANVVPLLLRGLAGAAAYFVKWLRETL